MPRLTRVVVSDQCLIPDKESGLPIAVSRFVDSLRQRWIAESELPHEAVAVRALWCLMSAVKGHGFGEFVYIHGWRPELNDSLSYALSEIGADAFKVSFNALASAVTADPTGLKAYLSSHPAYLTAPIPTKAEQAEQEAQCSAIKSRFKDIDAQLILQHGNVSIKSCVASLELRCGHWIKEWHCLHGVASRDLEHTYDIMASEVITDVERAARREMALKSRRWDLRRIEELMAVAGYTRYSLTVIHWRIFDGRLLRSCTVVVPSNSFEIIFYRGEALLLAGRVPEQVSTTDKDVIARIRAPEAEGIAGVATTAYS